MNEFIEERDAIIAEIGGFNEDDFIKSGISLDEYNNPNAETISKLLDYVKKEYSQVPIYNQNDNVIIR